MLLAFAMRCLTGESWLQQPRQGGIAERHVRLGLLGGQGLRDEGARLCETCTVSNHAETKRERRPELMTPREQLYGSRIVARS